MERGPFGAPSASSSSYGGFPLACRAVAVVAETVRTNRLADRARNVGGRIIAQLRQGLADAPIVKDVHGRGLAIGIELNIARKNQLHQVFQRLLRAGVLVMTGGHTLRLYPPLTADEHDLNAAANILISTLQQHQAPQ